MNLLILSAYHAHHYGKTIYPDGRSEQSSKPSRWSVYPAEIENLRGFSEVALKIEADHPSSSITLGELSERGAEAVERGDLIYRRHNHERAETNHIKDRAQHLLFLDVEFEDGLDHLSDEERIERHIQRLPECFRDSSYHAQLSSSYRFKDGLRVHLFFWASAAITCQLWRAYLQKINKDQQLVDHQPITPSNAITMTRPRMEEGFSDPIKQRSMFVSKGRCDVELPSSAYRLPPIRRHTPTKFYSTGVTQEDKWARQTLEEICRYGTQLSDGRNEQAYRDALKLGSLVGADRLNEYEVIDRLLQVYEMNGLIKKRTRRDVERTIRRGIEKGKLNPFVLEDRYSSLPARSIRPKAPSVAHLLHSSQGLHAPQARSSDEEIERSTAELISESFKKATPKVISIAESMTGAGKSRALITEAVKAFRDGGSIIYLARNHALIEGQGGLLSRFQNQGVEPDVWRGRRRRCEELKRLQGESDPRARALLAEYDDLLIEHPIPQFCRSIQCPLFETDHCSAWKAVERPIERRLILAPQAYLSYLVEREEKGELPEDLIIIIDERHDLIHSTPYDLDQISALSLKREDQKYLDDLLAGVLMTPNHSAEFRARHQPVSTFALKLHEALKRFSGSINYNQYGSRERLTQSLLLSIDKELRVSAEDALSYIEREQPKVHGLNLKELRKAKIHKIISGERVKRSGLRILTDLAQLLTGQLDDLHTLHLFINSEGAHVERRVIQPLPESSRLILADATPTEEILGDYAQVLGFELVKTSSEVTPHPVDGLHIQTASLRQSALFESRDKLRDAAIKSLNNLAHPISLMLRKLSDDDQVGLLCSKSLHDKIIEGMRGEGALTDNGLIKELSRFQLTMGYYGRDERGSNEFERCKALVVLGEAKPNLGSAQADIEALTSKIQRGEDFDQSQRFRELYREQVDSATVQAFGRLRSVWNPNLTFIHATEHTANLKGVRWTVYQPKGRAIDQATQEVEKRAHRALDVGGELTIQLLKHWGLSKDSAPRMIDRIAAIRPLKEEKRSQGRGRRPSAWFDPKANQDKFNDRKDLAFNRVSQKCSPPQLDKRIAVEESVDDHQVSLKSGDPSDLMFNRVSQKWSLSQLMERAQRGLISDEISAQLLLYIKGLTRINTKVLEYNSFYRQNALDSGPSPEYPPSAYSSLHLMEATL